MKLNTSVVFNLETGWLARGGREGGIVPPTLHDAPKERMDLWNMHSQCTKNLKHSSALCTKCTDMAKHWALRVQRAQRTQCTVIALCVVW